MMEKTVKAEKARTARKIRTATTHDAPDQADAPCVERVNTRFLETLMGYNARRAALTIIAAFLKEMEVLQLRPVEFSVLSLIARNPGITSRQLCDVLDMLAPNLVGMVNALERRGLIARHPHPHDRRAVGLTVTAGGAELSRDGEKRATRLEVIATAKLTDDERKQLIQLLKKIYK